MIMLEEYLTNVITNDIPTNLNIIDIKSFNNYLTLLRTTALVMRFIRNLRKKKTKKYLRFSTLDSTEIEAALKIWIQYTQKTLANIKNYKQLQHDLNLKNVDGVIRCYGRLKNAPTTSDMKHPIFLPRDSEFTDLVIYYHHSLAMHNGVKETLNQLRGMFWVPKARNYIKKLIQRCHLCKRFEGLPYSYPGIPLRL